MNPTDPTAGSAPGSAPATNRPDARAQSYRLVYINAGNDTNGNPRRGWIIGYGTDHPYFCDEGYQGPHALIAHGISPHEARDLPALLVTPGCYRQWKRLR